MARINFEERIFKDQGFQDLMIDVRSRLLAKGIVVELFQLAQEYWFPNQLPIPMDRFEAAGLPPVLFAPGGLCEKRDGGVYVRGSKDAFAWLFEKAEAGKAGGLKSAEVRKRKFGTAQPGAKPQKRRSSPEAAPKQRSNDAEANEASLLSSLSSSLSSPTLISSSLKVATGVASLEPVGPTAVSRVWNAYEEEYEKRYRVKPTRNAKVMGQIAQFVKRVPMDEAPSIVRYFLSHPKTFYVQKLHEFGLCLNDAESLRTQFLAKTTVTDSMVQEYRQKASQPREKGIAEIMAERGQPIEPRLVSGGEHDPV